MRCTAVVSLLACACASALAQTPGVSTAQLRSLEWRAIGPAATGGRIADIAVSKRPGRTEEMYVATTSGGVFKSSNGGVSFTPIFDDAGGMMSIGAVAVAPSNPAVVWVGTGESDNRQSSSWGDGVYKSVDAGASWQKMGLAGTRHIGRIVIHPTDPNIVYIAAVGHLWGSNTERGVFKTTDGGQTWSKVLYRDEHTGAIDLVLDPTNPSTLYAALYQRQRKGWGFNGGGPGSGIYRTADSGATWAELTNGLPQVDKGRIGLAVFEGDPRIVYAIVEAGPAGGTYRSQDRGESWEHLSSLNPRPMYYSRIFVDPREANRVYLLGSYRGFYISDNGGGAYRDIFSAVHSEDHALWINPENTNHLVAGGDGGVAISYDRGLTWLFRSNLPIGQFYTVSANNQAPYLICGGLQDNGSWCTPSATNISYGISFKDAFNVGAGDGMHALFADENTLLISSQNGATTRLDLRNMERQVIGPVQPFERRAPGSPPYRWYWTTPLIVSRFSPNTIYTAANHLFRSGDRGVTWKAISPDLTSNIDRETLQMMGSPVPPRALSRHDGQATFSAITAIAESPLDRNVLYTGADDGAVQVTRDGGKRWTNLTPNLRGLPPMLNISAIAASKHAPGRVYLSADGHFNDDYRPYIFVSEDYGATWRPIVAGLPEASVHIVREHPANPDFLVAGLELGAWASFDRGATWVSLGTNLPTVPVYDLVFQQSTGALILGTHGRGIWVLDQAAALARLTPAVWNGNGQAFPVEPVYHKTIYEGQYWFGAGEFFAPNPASGAVITYYLPQAASAVSISISDGAGKTIRTVRGPAVSGLNRACWDLRQEPPFPLPGRPPAGICHPYPPTGRGGPLVLPGKYRVTISTAAGAELRTEVLVGPNPRFTLSEPDRKARHAAVMSAYSLQRQLGPAREAIQAASAQIASMRQQSLAAGAMPPAALEKASGDLTRAQNELVRVADVAGNLQAAMDAYAGLPTAAQMRQLAWAWEDATAAVAMLNNAIQGEMTAARSTLGDSVKWPALHPVAPPAR